MENNLLDLIKNFQDELTNYHLKAADKDYNAQDARFIKEMVDHHEMAVDMANKEISKGKEPEAIALAKAIRDAQKKEISQMKKWLKDRETDDSGGGGGMGGM